MYRVLYRKWRPQIFSDVVGQEQITATLKNEIISGRLSHAYLFVGSRGTGKTTCAKILSKAVNCLNMQDGNPCNECEICKGIDNGSVVDVVEIDAASNNGVDYIRALREEVNYNPATAKYRVYIIDEVHMLSLSAYNALLKTLEEPPEHVIFILATTEVHKIPATILSRCQRFNFNRIPATEIADRVKYIAVKEGMTITDEAALLISRLADGAMRDALSILDQCQTGDITIDSVTRSVGLIGRDYFFSISDAILNENTEYLLQFVDSIYTTSIDMERLCSELSEFFRNLLVCAVSKEPKQLIVATDDEIKRYCDEAQKYTVSALLTILRKIGATGEIIRQSMNRRVEMEMLLISLSKPKLSTDAASMLSRIESIERTLRSGDFKSTDRSTQTEFVPAPEKKHISDTPEYKLPVEKNPFGQMKTKAVPSESETNTDAKVSESEGNSVSSKKDEPFLQWPEAIEEMKKLNRPLAALTVGSTAVIRGDYVLIESPNPTFKEQVKKKSYATTIAQAVYNVTGKKYKIGVINNAVASESGEAKTDALSELAKRARELGANIKID